MKSKVGPLSVQEPLEQRLDGIKEYFVDVPTERVSSDVIEMTKHYFSPIKGLRLRSRPRVIEKMRLSTNSGSPFFTKRKNVVSRNTSQYDECAILGWRGQEGGIEWDDVKQRAVFMMPFDLNIRELQFYQPFIEAVQKKHLIPAYISMDYVDQVTTRLFDTKGPDDYVVTTDFTKFDQSFNPSLQEVAREVINYLIVPQDRGWIESVFPVKYNIPLLCSEDLMLVGAHGMGSGSGGTNADESIAHKALQLGVAAEQGEKLNPNSMAYGDDGVLTYPGIKVDEVMAFYQKFGLKMNPDKQMVSKTETIILRRWYNTNYRKGGQMKGVYSTFRALGRLLGQERYYDPRKWGPELVTLRAWSIIENCNNHPLIDEFIEFVIKGDKYKLGLLIPGFFDRLDRVVRDAEAISSDFLGYTKGQLQKKEGIQE